MTDERRRCGGIGAVGRQRIRRRQVHVVLKQTVVRACRLADLERVSRISVRASVHTLPIAVQVVEAVVLFVDDNDVIDSR